ncbi:DUF11 domain-containing protein [Conexibacter arvalis]|uniref:Putative repeat protein (TIGR01451 family) n=1 Tax=Conexibacter arvalis TaxID=912552 RepID=A0A840I924_9ACTN|nr:DUF11 domain-containing protein [Conexibacter arvalis]MBB4660608.1 putative repeat protein (TIGR01451 family) [Conexibacter arvalis]
MAAYSDAAARSADGQRLSITLPGGAYTVSFTIRSRPLAGPSAHPAIDPLPAPLARRFPFGSSDYVGVPGRPVLYARDAGALNGAELTLSEIEVVDGAGARVTGWRLVAADAENNIATPNERLTWTSDRPLSLIGVMNGTAPRGCRDALSGLGTTTVTCIGQGSDPPGAGSSPVALYDGVIVGADTPSTLSLALQTTARSGAAFALQTAKVEVAKQVAGRVRASDAFDLAVTSPEGTEIASASTGASDAATTGETIVLPRTDGASYTLSEAAAAASGTRLDDYARAWTCTNDGVADPSLPSGGGTSVAVSPAPGDDIACTVVNTQLPADLGVTKTAASERLTPGGEETYTLTVTNAGPSRATSVRVEDRLPAGLSFVAAGAGCGVVGATVTCAVDSLDSGATRTFEVSVRVATAAVTCTQLTNAATVASDTPDPNPANDVSAVCVPQGRANVGVVKRATPTPIVPGGEIAYRLDVFNRGPDPARGVVVTDVLPRGLRFLSVSAGCGEAGGTVTCALDALPNGATESFAITMRAPSSLASCPSNTATVRALTIDPDPSDDESTVCPSLRGRADLSIAKRASAASVPAGGQVMYVLTVANDGPSDASGVTVDDPLAPGLALVSAKPGQGSCAIADGRVSCALGSLEAGGSTQVLVTATALPGAGCTVNVATVRGDQQDGDLSDNSATATVCAATTPGPPPPGPPTPPEPTPPTGAPAAPFDLHVTKRADRRAATIGERITYRIRVVNRGGGDAPDARLTDTFAASGRIVSLRASQGRCTRRFPVTCRLGQLRAGAAATVAVVVAPTSFGRAKRNVVSATGDGTDAKPAGNIAGVSATVRRVPLRLAKAASRASVRAGDTFSYRCA